MCGIACLLSYSGFNISPYIHEMSTIIKHRGPDDEGYVFFHNNADVAIYGGDDTPPTVYQAGYYYSPIEPIRKNMAKESFLAMGHRRLAIVDLSAAGHQPMCTKDKRYWIIYNGEVYNHLELKRILEVAGVHFYSHADTEVILQAYIKWGEKCLEKFNGMFAFVIYDTKTRQLFAARDRFGIKPFYYWLSPEGFLAFASEIKQFTVLPGWKAVINKQQAYNFLAFGLADHGNGTMFAEVIQLPGGCYFTISADTQKPNFAIKRWYTLHAKTVNLDFTKASDRFYELFFSSIDLRLRADVDVGTGLSGGLDSSSIVCAISKKLAAKKIYAKQNTFSACAHNKKYDEREYIDEVVRHAKVNAHYVYPSSEDLFREIKNIIWHQDEPFGSTSIYAEWSVFNLVAKSTVKVTLDGHGADELLCGYHTFFGYYLRGLLANFNLKAFAQEIMQLKKMYNYSAISLLLKSMQQFLPNNNLKNYLRNKFCKNSYLQSLFDKERFNDINFNQVKEYINDSLKLQEFSRFQLLNSSLPIQLHWADRDSMAHSIECRVPFLDYRLVEFVLGCADNYKIKHGITKRLLRSSMHSLLPNKIRARIDKMGFVTPEEVWVKSTQRQQFFVAIEQAIKVSCGLIKPEAIIVCRDMMLGKIPYNSWMWRVICFGLWVEFFNVYCN